MTKAIRGSGSFLGAGGSISWADPDARLAVAIGHNRMTHAPSEVFAPIRAALEDDARQWFDESATQP